MQRRQLGIDLNHAELLEFEDMGFGTHLLETPRIDDSSDSFTFRNNPSHNNLMFNSPLRRPPLIIQPTPMINFPSLGFTPYTPKQTATNKLDVQSSKKSMNPYQILNFDQEEEGLNEQTSVKRKQIARHQSLSPVYETPAKQGKKRDQGLSLKRTQRKRKQIEMIDYVKTGESKCYRGLRNLASSVRQITNKLGTATAKEIADTLTKQLQEQKQIAPNSRQQQNIKRRVYDALKVLVSADVLIRDGEKKLIARPSSTKNSNLEATYLALKEKIALTKKSIQEKSQKVVLMNNKWVVGQQLIQLNKVSPSPSNQRIYFPLVGVCTPQENLENIRNNSEQGTTSIMFKKGNVKLVGDIDLVLQLRIMQQRAKAIEIQKLRKQSQKALSPQKKNRMQKTAQKGL